MIFRLEVWGRVLHVEYSRPTPPDPEPNSAPVDVPQPMVTYAEDVDPIGFRMPPPN